MKPAFESVIKKYFEEKPPVTHVDVLPLGEAIKQYIKPGMNLLMEISHNVPFAACHEILRQFYELRNDFTFTPFTITSMGCADNINILVHTGLVNKLITTYSGDVFPSPAPNRTFTNAVFNKLSVKIEHWSFLALAQRLFAGASNFEFMPTNSLQGTGMERDNKDSFQLIEDPFGSEKQVGVLKKLNPDLAIVHAWAADPYGNLLITPPYAGSPYGALACKKGIMATVEKMVSAEFMRDQNNFMVIPGYLVNSVSICPLGVHPAAFSAQGIPEFEAYERDYDFYVDFRKATTSDARLDSWIKEWILDVKDHAEYLDKLGHERIYYLKGRALKDAWRAEIAERIYKGEISDSNKCNDLEMMIVVAAHKMKEKIKAKNLKTVLAGQGVSNLAAWLAYYFLKQEGYNVSLMAEVGFLGYEPRPASPFIFNFGNIPTCQMLTDTISIMGLYLSGLPSRCLGALGAAQIDKHGNINSTQVQNLFVLGCGGANDVTSCADETVVVVPSRKGRFPENVPYVSCTGESVHTLVTTRGVFERGSGLDEFSLVEYLPFGTPEEIISRVQAEMGWNVKISSSLKRSPQPSLEELLMLRMLDPRKNFIA